MGRHRRSCAAVNAKYQRAEKYIQKQERDLVAAVLDGVVARVADLAAAEADSASLAANFEQHVQLRVEVAAQEIRAEGAQALERAAAEAAKAAYVAARKAEQETQRRVAAAVARRDAEIKVTVGSLGEADAQNMELEIALDRTQAELAAALGRERAAKAAAQTDREMHETMLTEARGRLAASLAESASLLAELDPIDAELDKWAAHAAAAKAERDEFEASVAEQLEEAEARVAEAVVAATAAANATAAAAAAAAADKHQLALEKAQSEATRLVSLAESRAAGTMAKLAEAEVKVADAESQLAAVEARVAELEVRAEAQAEAAEAAASELAACREQLGGAREQLGASQRESAAMEASLGGEIASLEAESEVYKRIAEEAAEQSVRGVESAKREAQALVDQAQQVRVKHMRTCAHARMGTCTCTGRRSSPLTRTHPTTCALPTPSPATPGCFHTGAAERNGRRPLAKACRGAQPDRGSLQDERGGVQGKRGGVQGERGGVQGERGSVAGQRGEGEGGGGDEHCGMEGRGGGDEGE